MRNKLFAIAATLLLTLSLAVPVCATSVPGVEPDLSGFTSDTPRLVDDADILTADEEESLLYMMNEISERQLMDVVIVTVPYFEGYDVEEAALAYYEKHDFGYGKSKDGVQLFISMGERDLNLSAEGFGLTAFTVYGREALIDEILPELGEDEFYLAFSEYLTWVDDFINQAKAGTPYDSGHPLHELTLADRIVMAAIAFVVCLIIGAVIAFIIVAVTKKKLISVERAVEANEYVRPGSLHLRVNQDIFSHRHVDRRPKPKENSKSSSSRSTSSKF